MKRWMMVAALALVGASADAAWYGKLDFEGGPRPYAGREFNDGLWVIGGKQPLHAIYHDQQKMFGISFLILTRLEGQSPAYGLTAGIPVSAVMHSLAVGLESLGGVAPTAPPFMGKLGDWVSVEGFVAGRPILQYDEHALLYGVGGEVRIPWDGLSLWAKGANGQKGL